ncbi:hypothetical protein KJZ71_02800 [Patescibacteria group bacterium]|uniref:Uncharacterized protein n=1 Tax=candidate division WWE3 bacterium TaxID=2053526 RepID=A0A928Y6G7_UNCKA|nr:hypothetical protein [candidate division WWE3 bacterium]MCL4732709.1 hypothetical protein [Patescibacteria group bacterium]MDL1952971.1 hypothetical protein [Candidatus Uhrbacteria bacterium UHB]RIL00687.1 MAG: hypothetical protein DCC77_04055 [Candidatus Uhrbacteria bacterium]
MNDEPDPGNERPEQNAETVLSFLPVLLLFDVPVAFCIAIPLRILVNQGALRDSAGILIGLSCCTFIIGLIVAYETAVQD